MAKRVVEEHEKMHLYNIAQTLRILQKVGFDCKQSWSGLKEITLFKKHHSMRDFASYIEIRNTLLEVDPEDYVYLNSVEQGAINLLFGFGRQNKFLLHKTVPDFTK